MMNAVVSAGTITGAVLLLILSVEVYGFPKILKLERAIPATHKLDLSELIARDRVRHGRLLQSSSGVIDFTVNGASDPFLTGLYYTTLGLGNPPREFHVQVDTGSDVLWVNCASCVTCPNSTALQFRLNFFDPGSSSTASMISCSDQRCSSGVLPHSSDSGCSSGNNECAYTFQYGDGSSTSGYYVSDSMYYNTVLSNTMTTKASAPIIFGCSNLQTGDLTTSDKAVDGILGFGQRSISVISQLASQGLTPKAFSHCLRGDSVGGGILVLGEIVDPNMVFTPLIPSQPHYNLELRSISVNGQLLPIDSSVFSVSGSNQGTIVDTGTTLAYLPEGAYYPFVEAITTAVRPSVSPFLSKGHQCYILPSSDTDIFPQVSLNFAGGASIILNAQDYLVKQSSVGSPTQWCLGFDKMQAQITILGDVVLKDKIFVYDLDGQRIGWANYDCSVSVNVSTTPSTGRNEVVNTGQLRKNNSLQNVPLKSIPKTVIALLLHILMLRGFVYYI